MEACAERLEGRPQHAEVLAVFACQSSASFRESLTENRAALQDCGEG